MFRNISMRCSTCSWDFETSKKLDRGWLIFRTFFLYFNTNFLVNQSMEYDTKVWVNGTHRILTAITTTNTRINSNCIDADFHCCYCASSCYLCCCFARFIAVLGHCELKKNSAPLRCILHLFSWRFPICFSFILLF